MKVLPLRCSQGVRLFFVLEALLIAGANQTSVGAALGIQTLHKFADGSPVSGPVQGADGAFYGTAATGGDYDLGAIYRMNASGDITTLITFNGTNGAEPYARLLPQPNGTFYGTTRSGGSNDLGTVFRVTMAGALDTLFHFNGTNGAHPFAAAVEGVNGELYGTTESGGIGYSNSPYTGLGTVFCLHTNGSLTTLHYFNGTNRSYPRALMRAANEKLYGVATEGGAAFDGSIYSGYGGVFQIDTNDAFALLGSFTGPTGSVPGNAPMSLVQGTNGILYGTTWGGPYQGSLGFGTGTLFKYDLGSSNLTSIFTFLETNGSLPLSLDLGDDGCFYGMTFAPAVLFCLRPDETVTTLAHFPVNTLGAAGLVRASDGHFYGATQSPAAVFRAVQVPVIQSLSISNDGSRVVEWRSFTNGLYRVERNSSLSETNWSVLTPDVIASGTSAFFIDTLPSETAGFYRVLLLPPKGVWLLSDSSATAVVGPQPPTSSLRPVALAFRCQLFLKIHDLFDLH